MTKSKAGLIRAGIGGWTFEPWRGVFYPDKLPQAQELHYASRQLATIEVNGTYYRSQTPKTYAKWAADVPDGFIFSLKGPRFAVNRKVLGEAGEFISRFFKSGPLELGEKLGPILWQFAPTKKFDEEDFAAFLALLPDKLEGLALRHTVEVRHPSFAIPEFIALLRRRNVAVTFSEHATYPAIADVTADFVYARLQKGKDSVKTGYAPSLLEAWGKRAHVWASGHTIKDLPLADPDQIPDPKPRDVFVYFIHEGKVRAPAAAMAFMEKVNK